MTYQSVKPYSGNTLKAFDRISDEQLEKALEILATCFETWGNATLAERTAAVARAAAILRARVDGLARPVTLEPGQPIDQARGEAALSADILAGHANNAERLLAPQHLEPRSGEGEVESSACALLCGDMSEDEAMALANDSDFGLGGAVFTRDVARARRVAAPVRTGMRFVNHPTWTTPDLPFGGMKKSGYGRKIARMGVQAFVHKQLVRVASIDAAA